MLSNNVNFKSVKWPKIKATGGGGGGGVGGEGGGGLGVEVNFEICCRARSKFSNACVDRKKSFPSVDIAR